MSRRIKRLSEEELSKIVQLRQARTGWVEIQRQTKIDRRIAKRFYDDWQRNQSMEELRGARKDIAAEEFRKHMFYLIKLAQTLVRGLDIPRLQSESRSAQGVLNTLLQDDVLGEYSPYGLPGTRWKLSSDENIHLNEQLFQSLKAHTPELRWDAVSEWEGAWDTCIQALDKLNKAGRVVINNILNQEKGVRDKVKRGSKKKDVIEQMLRGVLHMAWQNVLDPNEKYPVVQVLQRSDKRSEIVFGDDKKSEGLILSEVDSVIEVKRVSEWAANNLYAGEVVSAINQEIRIMHERLKEVREMANPLLLGPVILRTRCELCPA